MQQLCAYEAAVSAAVQSRLWDEETSHHVASCILCGEVIRAAEWTRSLAPEPDWPPLRDPDLLWIEAHLLSAQLKRDRTMQVLMLEGAYIALLGASAAMLVLNLGEFSGLSSEILRWMTKFGNLGPLTIDLFSTASPSTLLTLLLVAVTFLIHPFLLEE